MTLAASRTPAEGAAGLDRRRLPQRAIVAHLGSITTRATVVLGAAMTARAIVASPAAAMAETDGRDVDDDLLRRK